MNSLSRDRSLLKFNAYADVHNSGMTSFAFLQDMPGGGDYIKRGGSEAAPTFEHNRINAWHGLVTLEGMAVLAGVPGASNAEGMRKAVTKLWWSLCERERRNTGALFSGDKAGNSASNSKEASKPQVAAMWAKLSTAVLALSGNSVVVDELELTLYNAGLFLMVLNHYSTGISSPLERI